METSKMENKKYTKLVLFLVISLILGSAAQADLLEDFDSLGGNDILLDKAKVLEPDKKVSIVQNRVVKRRFRSELGTEYSSVFGGETFLETQSLGLRYNFHINPRWSVGLNYFKAYNGLSKEGTALIRDERLIPDVDHLRGGYGLNVNWYPIYGKFSLYNLGVVHFDFYALASYGQVELSSGKTGSYSYGLGVGFWLSKHLTSRIEVKQSLYDAERDSGPVGVKLTSGSVSMGYLF